MKSKLRLGVTPLEDRSLPATFGIPWADPNISLSFAPDGTPVAGRTSNLFAGLNASQSTTEWQEDILRAFYTWSVHANFDISVTPDAGATFGTPGRLQNDPRFGDIRIGGNSLASDVLAVGLPPDPALAGTLAGDIFVNTYYQFSGSPYDIYTVMLHEGGHALGLDHSNDPNSPLYPRFNNTVSNLTAGDISAIRALYGPRVADRHEGTTGNGTSATATGLGVPTNYSGATPLLGYGSLSTATDKDIFYFDTISGRGENHNVTLRVQSSGLSLLGAKVTVYYLDSNGNPQEAANMTSDSADITGDTLTVTFDGNDDDDFTSRRYYVRVEKAESAPFTLGRFAVAVSFDGENTVPAANLNQVILGSYHNLGANDLAALLQNPNTALVNVDGGTNDTRATATQLAPTASHSGMSRHEAIGSIGAAADTDYFRIVSPKGRDKVLTVNAWALPNQAAKPQLAVFDSFGHPVASQILVNDSGSYTIQAANLAPSAEYFVRLLGVNGNIGNYFLTADFGNTSTNVQQFTQGTLATETATRTDTLYIGQTQLFHLTLAASGTGLPSGSAVRMTLTNAAGTVMLDLTAAAGDTVSGPSVLLTPGAYTVRFTAIGTGLAPISFAVSGNRTSDPVGPVVDDPTLEPTYRDPLNPNQFIYPPNGFVSTDPFYWFFG